MSETATEPTEGKAYAPAPGGMVDTARKAKAAAQAQAHGTMKAEGDKPREAKPVKVHEEDAQVFTARSLVLGPGTSMLLLPQDKNRKRATITVVTASATAVLSPSESSAQLGNGFILPTGLLLPVESQGILYVGNPTGANLQVTALMEMYA